MHHHRLIIFTLLSIAIVSAAIVAGLMFVSQPPTLPKDLPTPVASQSSFGASTSSTAIGSTTATTCPPASLQAKKNQYQWSSGSGPYRDQISYATSSDLLRWTASSVTLAEHASVPDAIVKDGVVWVYFVDVTQDGKPEQLGVMTSSDNGASWSAKQFVEIDGLCDKVPVDPDPFVLPDGRIRLSFFDISVSKQGQSQHAIYSATSTDGVHFTLDAGARYTDEDIFDPDLVKVGETYYLYVGTGSGTVTVATSNDGQTFTKKGTAYTSGAVPNVYYDGTKFILYVAGIEMAYSSDGLTFTKQSSTFRVPGTVTADPGVVQLSEGKYLMVFKTQIAQAPPR